MSDTFCASPFQHLCIGYEGKARICCITSDLVAEGPINTNKPVRERVCARF
jgi:hypothetical protein